MYEQTTDGVVIRVTPEFRDDQSSPEEQRFVWSYTVEIENTGDRGVRLIARRWTIIDALGRTEEVTGAGVVGEQPRLQPGESFRYTSGAPLPTPSGLMRGAYQMQWDDGVDFEAIIPPFSLDSPHEAAQRRPH